MEINNKGMVFSIIAIVFVSIMAVIFFMDTQYNEKDSQAAIEARITTMDTFLKDFYVDVSRASLISGYRGFIAMEEFITEPSNANIPGVTKPDGFYVDPSVTFIEVFMNGTIGGTSVPLMNNATFTDYQVRVNKLTETIGIIFNATVTDAVMNQSSPWYVDVYLDFDIYLEDMRGLASWNFKRVVITQIPITDLKDPLYTIHTGLPVTVRQFQENEFVLDGANQNDTTNLNEYISGTYFINSTRAPSYVQRFQNDLTPSPYGIESIVNMEDLANKDPALVEGNASTVDFMYFNDSKTPATECDFEGVPAIPAWFKIDNESLESVYKELEIDLEYSSC